MPSIQDFMFGDQILPEKRLERQRAALTGVQHQMDAQPAQPRPGENIRLRATTSGNLPYQVVHVFFTLDGSLPQPGSCNSISLAPAEVTWDHMAWAYITHWEGWLPAQAEDTLVRYRVGAQTTASQSWVFADNQATEPAQATNFALWVSNSTSPSWAQAALVYHVFVDRFYPGSDRPWQKPERLDGYYGGTLRGVIEKLAYIQELGYNTIWLSPFFASPSHHGYDAADMYRVEPRLGTNADLYELIELAHQRGLRLILDFVANHWSNRHPSLQAAQKDRNSPYYDWYLWKKWPDEYEGYFGVKSMPKLNLTLGSPARQYLLDCARFWLEKGFDGYRLDFAYGPPLDFWVDFRRVCKQTRPDCWLFGEVIQSAPEQKMFAGAFDGLIDFLLAEALRQTFGYEHWQLGAFDAFIQAHEAYFGGVVERLTILDNHDMNRFLFLAGNDKRRLKLGALLIYTLAGSPINYYGTEAGVSQERPTHYGGHGYFEEARQPMRWGADADPDLLQTFQRLTTLRQAQPVLRQGSRQTVHLDAQRGTYAYLRQLANEKWLVSFNLSEEFQTLELPGLDGAGVVDQLSEILPQPVSITRHPQGLNLVIPPMSGALLSGLE